MPKRPIRIDGDLAYVPLTQGYEALIDAADVALVAGRNWTAHVRQHTVYAKGTSVVNGRRVVIYMHRVIVGAPVEMSVDHCDSNGLNNRKCNLRLATHAQNMRNRRPTKGLSSPLKGVRLHKRTGQWRASITLERKVYHLGLFDTEADAHAAYADASRVMHGTFGRTN